MNILLAHNNHTVKGGAEVFYRETGRVLEKNGHRVAYFSANEEGITGPWARYYPSSADYSSRGARGLLSFPRMVYSREAKKCMAALIRDFKPDLVHAFAIYVKLTPSILDACREAGVPVVMSCNDYKLICPNYKMFHHGRLCEDCYRTSYYMAMVNVCCHRSFVRSTASAIEAYVHKFLNVYRKNIHTFLFASEFMARKTAEFWGSDAFRWRLLKNPFDSTRYRQSRKDDGYLLYFGRMIEEKGVDILIDAMRDVPEARLVLAGSGPQEKALRDQCAANGLNNVEFAGEKWGDEMDRILERCRFVVIPSLWYENFPYVINQAFAMGKAVIGTDRGGIPELVKDGARGIIYDATDARALAAAIRRLWHDRDEAQAMGDAAKAYADAEFNDEVFYSNLMTIYRDIAG